jgi:hypothetical protein
MRTRCLEDFLERGAPICERVEVLTALLDGRYSGPWVIPLEIVFAGPPFARVLDIASVAPSRTRNIRPRFDG